jgi:methionine-rich copper-binding protein CopC
VSAVLAVSAPASLDAHSLLVASSPAARAVVPAPPSRIELRFNNRIERRLSAVELVGPRGERYPAPVLDDGPPDRLRAGVPALAPGVYRVEWRVLSTDGHVVTGTYTFTIRP